MPHEHQLKQEEIQKRTSALYKESAHDKKGRWTVCRRLVELEMHLESIEQRLADNDLR